LRRPEILGPTRLRHDREIERVVATKQPIRVNTIRTYWLDVVCLGAVESRSIVASGFYPYTKIVI